jgi:YegS/Rv2252/BmrU family lipid kinase
MHESQKNIAIVCNQLAGAGSAVALAENIDTVLSSKNIRHAYFNNTWPQQFNEFTDVWIVGGDGTLNYFLNHYPEIKLPLVIFKGGTGNDFHWFLYGDIVWHEQIQLALSAEPKPIDVGSCNGKLFINGFGAGFDGAVAKSLTGKKKKPGKASFMAMILRKIFTYRSKRYSIKADDTQFHSKRYMMIDICNGPRAGGGFYVAPLAKADDGFFDMILVDPIHSLQRLRWLPAIEKGKHLKLPFVKYIKSKNIIIESDSLIEFHSDGEYYSAPRLEIKILPAKLLFRY